MIPRDKNELLAHALRYLCEFMQVDRAAVFLYDEVRQTLVARQLVDRADVLPGEEEIAILPDAPLGRLLAASAPISSSMKAPTILPISRCGHSAISSASCG